MEFTADGDMIASSGEKSFSQTGSYELSNDGKMVLTKMHEKVSDTFLIDMLTKDTLKLTVKRAAIQWIMVPR